MTIYLLVSPLLKGQCHKTHIPHVPVFPIWLRSVIDTAKSKMYFLYKQRPFFNRNFSSSIALIINISFLLFIDHPFKSNQRLWQKILFDLKLSYCIVRYYLCRFPLPAILHILCHDYLQSINNKTSWDV